MSTNNGYSKNGDGGLGGHYANKLLQFQNKQPTSKSQVIQGLDALIEEHEAYKLKEFGKFRSASCKMADTNGNSGSPGNPAASDSLVLNRSSSTKSSLPTSNKGIKIA